MSVSGLPTEMRLPWVALLVGVSSLVIDGPAGACSMVVTGEARFDYSSYVFEGEVLEPVGPLRSDDWPGDAWGVRLAVTRAVHLPSPRAEYDVVPLEVEADCSLRTYGQSEVGRRFGRGETVRVVAVESQLGGGVLRICRPCGSYLETVAGSRARAAERWGAGVRGLEEGGQVIDDFEYRVVLLDLEAASTSSERAPLLLALAPYLGSSEALEAILGHHPADPEVAEEARRRWRRRHESEER